MTAWPAVANQALRTKAVENERSTEAKERVRRVIRTCRNVLVRAAIVQPASDNIVQAFRMPLGLEPLPLSRRQEEQIRDASDDMWLGSEPVNAARELKKDAARNMLKRCFSGEDNQHDRYLQEIERAMALLTTDASSISGMRLLRGPGGEPCAKEYRHKQSLQEMRKGTAACSAEGQSWLRQCCSKFKAPKLLIVFDVGHVMGKITGHPRWGSHMIWDVKADPILHLLIAKQHEYRIKGDSMTPKFCELAEATHVYGNVTLKEAWTAVAPMERTNDYSVEDLERAEIAAQVTMEIFFICLRYRHHQEYVLSHAFPLDMTAETFQRIQEQGFNKGRDHWHARDEGAMMDRLFLDAARVQCLGRCLHKFEKKSADESRSASRVSSTQGSSRGNNK